MDIGDVMDGLADAVREVKDLTRVFAYSAEYPPDAAVVVNYPDEIIYGVNKGSGLDELNIDVEVLMGRINDRSTRDRVTKHAAGSGPDSIREAIETYSTTAWDSVRVPKAVFEPVEHAGAPHVALVVTVNVIGPG